MLFLAANGLGVIGGDTTNLVGLGGCLPESKMLIARDTTVTNASPDFVSDTLPNYCAHGVLRSPTMWLGIFVGGCAFYFHNL